MDNTGSETQFYKLVNKFMIGLRNSKQLSEFHTKFVKYKETSDTEAMFRCFWESAQAHRYLSHALPPVSKSEEDAVKLKIKGDNYALKNKLGKALQCYNSAIINANHPNIDSFMEEKKVGKIYENHTFKTLYMTYAARASVLYELGQFDKCLNDIDRALAHGFPHFVVYEDEKQRLEKEILQMKSDATSKIKDVKVYINVGLDENNTDSNYTLKEIKYHEIHVKKIKTKEKDSKLDSDDKKEYFEVISDKENDIVYLKKEQENNIKDSKGQRMFAYRSPSPPVLRSINPFIPSLSDALSLQYSPDKGRLIVANRDIMPGELLAVDKGYVSCINLQDPDVSCSYCCLCFGRAPVPLPCPDCNMIVFCSEKCRILGLQKFHCVECPSLPTLADLSHTACIIKTHRIITQTTYPVLIRILPHLKQQSQDKLRKDQGENHDGVYDSSEYYSVYFLEANLQTRIVSELIHLSAGAFIVVKLLLSSRKFFVDGNGKEIEPTKEEIIQIGAACINHLSSTLCNGSAIAECKILQNIQSNRDHDLVKIGSGIFPSIALMNHSCCPTAVVYSYNNVDVCHSISFIPSGQEITISYGDNYDEENVETRRRILSSVYRFNCQCDACSSDWTLNDSEPVVKDPCDDTTSCHKMTQFVVECQLKDMKTTFNKIKDKLDNNETNGEEWIPTLIDILKFLEIYVKQPNLLHFEAQQLLCTYLKKKSSCKFL